MCHPKLTLDLHREEVGKEKFTNKNKQQNTKIGDSQQDVFFSILSTPHPKFSPTCTLDYCVSMSLTKRLWTIHLVWNLSVQNLHSKACGRSCFLRCAFRLYTLEKLFVSQPGRLQVKLTVWKIYILFLLLSRDRITTSKESEVDSLKKISFVVVVPRQKESQRV